MNDRVTRTQVKRSETNKTRTVVLSLDHFKLLKEVQGIYETKFNLRSLSLSTITRRGLELLKEHLSNETNVRLEQRKTENATKGVLNKPTE